MCKEAGVWVIADEIYEKLTYDGHTHVSFASVNADARDRTITVNGLSKAYSMTGWRIGYATGPRDVIGAMARIQSHATSCATSIAQHAGIAAISGPQDDLDRMRQAMMARRDRVLALLRGMDGVSCPTPHGAFYLFPNMAAHYGKQFKGQPVRDSVELSLYLLEQAHVAVVPGDAFGSAANIRISYATSTERLEEGMQRMARALSQLEPPSRADLDA